MKNRKQTKEFEMFKLFPKPGKDYLLTPLELKEFIDFPVKRIYFIMSNTGHTGQHCHYKEKEFFFCVQGGGFAHIDRGNGLSNLPFNAYDGFYVPNYVWHGFSFYMPNTILIALTSTNYDNERKDYLENYEEYLKIRDKYL